MSAHARVVVLVGSLTLVFPSASCHLWLDDFEAADALCAEGAFACDGRSLQICLDGAWTASEVCDESDLCHEDWGRCLQCKPDTYRCDGQQLQRCARAGDGWTEIVECAEPLVCNDETATCVTCLAGTARCLADATALGTCNSNASGWSSITFGATGCVDEPGDCDYCSNCSDEGRWVCSPCGKVLHCEDSVWHVIVDCLRVEQCVVDSSSGYCATE
jgi:hypothetical protein